MTRVPIDLRDSEPDPVRELMTRMANDAAESIASVAAEYRVDALTIALMAASNLSMKVIRRRPARKAAVLQLIMDTRIAVDLASMGKTSAH